MLFNRLNRVCEIRAFLNVLNIRETSSMVHPKMLLPWVLARLFLKGLNKGVG